MQIQIVKVNFLLDIKSVALDISVLSKVAISKQEAYSFEIGFIKSRKEAHEYLRQHNAQVIENLKENFGIVELHRLSEGKYIIIKDVFLYNYKFAPTFIFQDYTDFGIFRFRIDYMFDQDETYYILQLYTYEESVKIIAEYKGREILRGRTACIYALNNSWYMKVDLLYWNMKLEHPIVGYVFRDLDRYLASHPI